MMMMMTMLMTGMMCHWRARVSWSIPQGAGECNNVWPAIQYDILYKRWYLPHHHHRHITAQRSYPSSPSFNSQWWSLGWGQSCTIQASIQQWISLIALIVSDPISLRWNVLLFAIGLLWLPVEGFPILGGIAKCSGKCIETAESIKIIQDTGYGYKRVSLYVQHIKNCKLGWYFRILKHCLFSDCWQQLFIYPVCKERLCREIVRRLLSICAESFYVWRMSGEYPCWRRCFWQPDLVLIQWSTDNNHPPTILPLYPIWLLLYYTLHTYPYFRVRWEEDQISCLVVIGSLTLSDVGVWRPCTWRGPIYAQFCTNDPHFSSS